MSKPPVPMLPSSGPSGMLVPFTSWSRMKQSIDFVYDGLGGDAALLEEAKTDKKWFYKDIWKPSMPKVAHNEHTAGPGVEDLLEQMHARREARMVDITPVDNSKEHRYGVSLNSKGPPDDDCS